LLAVLRAVDPGSPGTFFGVRPAVEETDVFAEVVCVVGPLT